MKQNKIKNLLLTILALFLGVPAFAQVGIGTTNPQGVLDVKIANDNAMGIVLPRVEKVDDVKTPDGEEAIIGTMVFDLSKNCARVKNSTGWSNCLLDDEGLTKVTTDYLGLGSNVLAAKIAVSQNWSLILGAAHELYFSGNNNYGQSGLGRAGGAVRSFTLVLSAYPIEDIAAGLNHAIAADATGRVWTWGGNTGGYFQTGQTGPNAAGTAIVYLGNASFTLPDSCDFFGPNGVTFTPNTPPTSTPVPQNPKLLAKLVAATNAASFVVVNDGDLYSIGTSPANGKGVASTATLGWSQVTIPGNGKVAQISASLNNSTGVVTTDGYVYTWGTGANGGLGSGGTSNVATPAQINFGSDNGKIGKIAMGYQCGAAITQDGMKLYAWGARYAFGNVASSPGNITTPQDITSYIQGFNAANGDRIIDVSMGRYSTGGNIVVVTKRADGSSGVYVAGANSYGQLGVGNTTNQRTQGQLVSINWLRMGSNTQIVGAASGDRNTVLLTVTGEGDNQQPGVAYGAGRAGTSNTDNYRVLGALNGNQTYFTAMTK